jgi:putative flippase GtrA
MKDSRQMVHAGIGGAIGTGLDVTTLVLLVHVGLSIPVAAFLGASVGAVACFVFNKYVAFRDRSRITAHQLARFGSMAMATALLMAFAMKLVAVKLGMPVLPAKLLCAATIFILWTYPAQRRLVFRNVVTA